MISFRTNTTLRRLAVNKLLIAVAAAFLAVTALFGSGAEAGFNVRIAAPAGFSSLHKAGCGGGGYYRAYRKRSFQSASRRVKRNVQLANKPEAAPVTVAKAETEAEPKTEATTETAVAGTENSSVATGEGKVAEVKTAEPEKKVAAAKEVGCKKFFPSVGMTLSVNCE
jgi:hypothetical protein